MSAEMIAIPFLAPPQADIFPDVTPDVIPYGPVPLQVRVTHRPQPEGDVLRNFFLVWDDDDVILCRRCPLAKCSREPVPGTGTSTCLRMLRGPASARFAASLGVET